MFYNADPLEIYALSSNQITEKGFIDNTVLLVTDPSITRNCQRLEETHRLYMD